MGRLMDSSQKENTLKKKKKADFSEAVSPLDLTSAKKNLTFPLQKLLVMLIARFL